MRKAGARPAAESPEGPAKAGVDSAAPKSGQTKAPSKSRRTGDKGKGEDFDIEIVDLDDLDL